MLAQPRLEGESAMRVEFVLRGPLTTGHDDRHLVQPLGDGGPESHEGAEALHEIAELGASQERVEGTAETGAAWARLDRVGHALLICFFSSRRRHTRLQGDWSSDVCSSD